MFEQSAIGVAIVELNGRPVLANAALERFLGFTAAELRERTYHAITHPTTWRSTRRGARLD